MSLVAVIIIIERYRTYSHESIDLREFSREFGTMIAEARTALDAGKAEEAEQLYQQARDYCAREGQPDKNGDLPAKGCVAEVFRRAIDNRHRGPATLRNMLNNHIDLAILPQLRAFLRTLTAIGKGAPMVGLLGTVLGMMRAFGSIAAAGSGVNPKDLAGDIGLALGTTFLGLFVAIPVVFATAFFRAKVERFEIDLDRYSEYCLDLLFSDQPPTIMPETLEQTE
ncbi:MAG: MotA/TolQ/ExbB proton channel family protein [Planctomycetaceae bacterium]|nr:MotA/TolQ/ExbB proton channel family protein [Planctomycetaceae bacterium]